MTSDQPSLAKFWNRMAKRYAASKIGDPAGYEKSIERTRGFLTPHSKVLEIGCGTGSTALRHADHLGELVATDISPAMIEIAKEKQKQVGATTVQFIVAASDAPVVDPESRDMVMAHSILHLVSSLPETLAGVHRALKPGGIFISKTTCISNMNPLIGNLMIPALKLVGLAPPVNKFTREELVTAIGAAGFDIEAVENHQSKANAPVPFIIARKL